MPSIKRSFVALVLCFQKADANVGDNCIATRAAPEPPLRCRCWRSIDIRNLGMTLLVSSVMAVGPAMAQGYTYRYGDTRVVQQSSIGLPNPSSTYIGTGTLSKSAQGAMTGGPLANPGLPRVNHGSYVGTPGDNQYGNDPIVNQNPRTIEAKNARIRALREMQIQRQIQIPKQPAPNVYMPGQNENLNAGRQSGTQGGVFTYGIAPTSSDSSSARHY